MDSDRQLIAAALELAMGHAEGPALPEGMTTRRARVILGALYDRVAQAEGISADEARAHVHAALDAGGVAGVAAYVERLEAPGDELATHPMLH